MSWDKPGWEAAALSTWKVLRDDRSCWLSSIFWTVRAHGQAEPLSHGHVQVGIPALARRGLWIRPCSLCLGQRCPYAACFPLDQPQSQLLHSKPFCLVLSHRDADLLATWAENLGPIAAFNGSRAGPGAEGRCRVTCHYPVASLLFTAINYESAFVCRHSSQLQVEPGERAKVAYKWGNWGPEALCCLAPGPMAEHWEGLAGGISTCLLGWVKLKEAGVPQCRALASSWCCCYLSLLQIPPEGHPSASGGAAPSLQPLWVLLAILLYSVCFLTVAPSSPLSLPCRVWWGGGCPHLCTPEGHACAEAEGDRRAARRQDTQTDRDP